MTSSKRFLSGSLTKGSTAVSVGIDALQTDPDLYRQGINIRDFVDFSKGLSRKVRSHSDIKRAISNKVLDNQYYDDTVSPVILSGSSAQITSPSIAGRVSYYFDHERENRDLGQTDIYVAIDSPYTELPNPNDPVEVMKVTDMGKLPHALVDHSSLSLMDGRIDPMRIISSIDRSLTDFPYPAHGVRGNVHQVEDPFLRSGVIEDRLDLPSSGPTVTNYYLDAPELFGNVPLPSVFNFNDETIKPFKDTSGDIEEFLISSKKFTEEENKDIFNTLMSSSFAVDDRRENFDEMSVGGIEYPDGPDSIVFGGLKK